MELYPFQQEAVDKFCRENAVGEAIVKNVLLGDDMGLGKTPVGITIDLRRRKHKLSSSNQGWIRGWKPRTLVVTLKSTLSVWEEHYKDWAPGMRVFIIDPKNRPAFVKAAIDPNSPYDVFVCHWDILRLESDLRRVRWLHIIADEVHKVKNRQAQVTVAFKKIFSIYKTDMSGTWVDNRPDDGWSVLNHLYPGTWGSHKRFFDHHVVFKAHHALDDCEPGHNPNMRPYKEITGVAHAEQLAKQMAPFYIRRRKEDVLRDLPPKYYSRLWVDLSPQQKRAYTGMRRHMLAWIGEHEHEPLAAPVAIAQLVRLQQLACAYGEMVEVKRRAKDAAERIARGESPYEVVQTLRLTDPSSKLDTLDELIEQASRPICVFSQGKQVINMLAARLERKKVSHVILTGDTSASQRKANIEKFQTGTVRVFAGTIAAGGVGITLTAADTVVFLDRAWVPSANRQAEDRLHRIGQLEAVHVIDLVARDTVDMGRLQKLELKWAWLREILGDKGN